VLNLKEWVRIRGSDLFEGCVFLLISQQVSVVVKVNDGIQSPHFRGNGMGAPLQPLLKTFSSE